MSAHKIFRTSLIKFCQDSITAMVTANIVPADQLQFVDFDAHAELDKLPDNDILGVANLNWHNDTHFYSVGVQIGVSTFADTNNFRHNDIVDWLEPKLRPTCKIPLVDPTTGAETGWMVVEAGVALAPMFHTDTRSLQFMLLGLQTSLTA